jgi:hypothetical protein
MQKQCAAALKELLVRMPSLKNEPALSALNLIRKDFHCVERFQSALIDARRLI